MKIKVPRVVRQVDLLCVILITTLGPLLVWPMCFFPFSNEVPLVVRIGSCLVAAAFFILGSREALKRKVG